MPWDDGAMASLLYHALRELKKQDLSATAEGKAQRFDDRMADLLQEMQDKIPGVTGTILLSSQACAKPKLPVCSKAWNRKLLSEDDGLARLASYLKEHFDLAGDAAVTYHKHTADDPPEFRWLARALKAGRPDTLAIIPLKSFVPPEYVAARTARSLLVVALNESRVTQGGDVERPYAKELEFLAWIVTHVSINWESAGLARRYDHLADAIHSGVVDLLAQRQPMAGAATEFGGLVERVREHMNCDSCQLYLTPEYAPDTNDKTRDRVRLVNEAIAPFKPLRHGWGDQSLVSHIWQAGSSEPLNIPDLLRDEKFGRYALGPLGLTRCVLGLLLWNTDRTKPIGVLILRDNHSRDVQGRVCIQDGGFKAETEGQLLARAKDLLGMLEGCGGLSGDTPLDDVLNELERIRGDFKADRSELYLTPEFRGKSEEEADCQHMELYCRCRRSWCGDAYYVADEGTTGQVFASGKPIRIDDGFLHWTDAFEKEEESGSVQAGKYRLSQHVIAVPVFEPVQLRAAGKPIRTIGVLKIRDRLNRNEDALAADGFSRGDMRLLQAFAQMISFRIGNQESMKWREAQERERAREIAGTYRHEVGNFACAIKFLLGGSPGDTNEAYVVGADRIVQMLNRSLAAARVAADQNAHSEDDWCDLQAVWRNLFHNGSISTDATYSIRATVQSDVESLAEGTLVKCGQTLLEVAILVLPAWLYEHTPNTLLDGKKEALTVKVVSKETSGWLHIGLVTSVAIASLDESGSTTTGLERPIVYPKCLISPPVPWNTLANQLGHYGVILRKESHDEGTQVWIDLPRLLENADRVA